MSTANGVVKARIPSNQAITPGEVIGLEFDARTLSLFDEERGHALLSEANEGVLRHG
ncbi:hypothetical protein D3C72_2052530 [compost metagenome]